MNSLPAMGRLARAALSAEVLPCACASSPAAAARRPKAPEKGPIDVTGAHRRAQGRARHRGLRRADAELAGGQHPGARVGLARQAHVRRRLGRQDRPGAVPDGPEAVPGAGRRADGRDAAQSGGAAGGEGEPRAHQAARRSRTRCRRRTSTTRPASIEQAAAAVEQAKAQLEEAKLNLSYTTIRSPVDGVSSYARRRRRHVPESHRTRSSRPSRC